MAPPRGSRLLPTELEEQWMRYEYLKKNCIDDAHLNMCRIIRSEHREAAVNTWNEEAGTSDDNPTPRKMQKMDSSEDEKESESESSAEAMDVEEEKTLSENDTDSDSEYSDSDDNESEERALSGREYDRQYAVAWYNWLGRRDIKRLRKRKLTCSDIFEILFIRRNCPSQKEAAEKFLLPIKRIKVSVDYWRNKIEMFCDSKSDDCSRMEYWRFGKDCFIWYGDNVRMIRVTNKRKFRQRTYSKIAADDFSALVKHPEITFDELDFDVVPFSKGCSSDVSSISKKPRTPRMSFHRRASKFLFNWKQMSTVKFAFTTFRDFCDTGDGYTGKLWNHLNPTIIKFLKFRVWDDRKLIDYKTRNDRKVEDCKCGFFNPVLKSEQWKNAPNLCIQDFDFAKEWSSFETFSLIEMDHLEKNEVLLMLKNFRPKKPATIKLQYGLDLNGIEKFLRDRLEGVFADNTFTDENVKAEFAEFQIYVITLR